MGKTLIRKFLREYKKRPIVKHPSPFMPVIDTYSEIDKTGNVLTFKREEIRTQEDFNSYDIDKMGMKRIKRRMTDRITDYIALNEEFVHFTEEEMFNGTKVTGVMFIYRLID